MDLKKLKEEEKAAEELLYGPEVVENPDESALPGEEYLDGLDDEVETEEIPEPEAEIITQSTESDPEVVKKTRTSWKKRYTNYKASTDATLYDLRQENAGLRASQTSQSEAMDALRAQMQELQVQVQGKVDPFEGVFTPEDEETIGPEAINIIRKGVQAAQGQKDPEVADLKAELAAIKAARVEEQQRLAQSAAQDSIENLKTRLAAAVPDWLNVDTDPRFKEYLDTPDPNSGFPRSRHFQNAIESRDVSNLASFYTNFKASLPQSREEILAKNVTPTMGVGSSNTAPSDTTKFYTLREYTDFMDSITKGEWRGRETEARRIEAMFDKAHMEGRVV